LPTFFLVRWQPWFVEFTTYALASRLRASCIQARVTKVAGGYDKILEVLGQTPVSSNQEKVRSTT
jgi:hypothetical protein